MLSNFLIARLLEIASKVSIFTDFNSNINLIDSKKKNDRLEYYKITFGTYTKILADKIWEFKIFQKLFEINQQIKQFDKKKYYNFIIDTDTKEGKTRIIIDEFGTWKKTTIFNRRTKAIEFRKKGFRQFVPDLIDFKNKIIIEYSRRIQRKARGIKKTWKN